MHTYNNLNFLEIIVDSALNICNSLPLQEAVKMKEKDVLNYLLQRDITKVETQDAYLNLLRLYEFMSKESSLYASSLSTS